MQSRDTVVAVFDERDDAQDAINGLKDAGFAPGDVSVIARDRDTAGTLAEDTGTEAGAGAATGAVAGGLLGGVAGWLVGIGALAIPGVGPIIAAGPLAAALGGAALGAAGGGLIGALTGAGVPEEEATWYDERVKGGGILLTVNSRGRYNEALSIMREHGGRDYGAGTDTGRSARRSRGHDDDDTAETVGGSAVGGSVGAVGGGLVAGPPGAVAGAAIGGTAGAMAGDAAGDADDDDDTRRDRDRSRRV